MPIYEYACRACGAEVEKLQRMSDAPLTDCPECGKPELVRKVSAAGFRLKGTGWYETDFKSGNKHNLAADKKPAETGGKGAESKDAPAKPAETKSSPASSAAKATAGAASAPP